MAIPCKLFQKHISPLFVFHHDHFASILDLIHEENLIKRRSDVETVHPYKGVMSLVCVQIPRGSQIPRLISQPYSIRWSKVGNILT